MPAVPRLPAAVGCRGSKADGGVRRPSAGHSGRVLREGRHAVITFIDYSAAFDTESQLFLDSALADCRCQRQSQTHHPGVVRIRQPSGGNELSEPFNIERGVLQGDILSPVCFIAGLDKIFRLHDVANSGMVVGEAESAILVSKFEYADDAALVDENAALASTRVTALALAPWWTLQCRSPSKRVR